MAQSVEHVIGNDEVISSILITSSTTNPRNFLKKASRAFCFYFALLCSKLKASVEPFLKSLAHLLILLGRDVCN